MKSKLIFSLFLATAWIPSIQAEVVDKILATVNNEPITLYQLEKTVTNLNREPIKSPSNKTSNPKAKKALPASEELRQQALQHLVDESLLNQEIVKRGIKINEAEIDRAIDSILKRNKMTMEGFKKELASQGMNFPQYREDIKKQLLRLQFMSQVLGGKIRVTDEEVEAAYQQNAGQLQMQQVHIAQIVIPFSSNSEAGTASAKAKEIHQKLKKGANFEEVMKQEGGAGSGDLGKVPFSGLNANLASPLQKLSVGEITDPIKTENSFVILKLLEKQGADLVGREDIKENIRSRIYEIKAQQELQKYIDQLKGKAFINILS